jgi:hypothetical protein
MAKGVKTGGRTKGVPNKATASAKAAIELVFNGLGDAAALEQWARSDPDNLKAFYVSIWPKLLPLQVAGQLDHAVKVSGELTWQPPQ